jgi:hypothetical protein
MKKLLFLPLFFLSTFVSALTLSEIRTNARLLIKDTSSTRQRFTDAQINSFANEAHRDCVNNSWVLSKNTSITLVSGTTYYSLPTDTLAIQRVTREYRNLPETALIKLDGDFSNGAWANSGGTPTSYFQDPSQTDKIGFYPWPSGSTSTGTIRVIYFAQANTLSSDSDEPFNSEDRFAPYHDLLVYFIAYRVYLLEGELEKANLYRQEYESRLVLMAGRVSMKGNYVPSFSGGTRR